MQPIFNFPTTPRTYALFVGLCFLLTLITFGSLSDHQFEIDNKDYLLDA
jgi:hypothetical protein